MVTRQHFLHLSFIALFSLLLVYVRGIPTNVHRHHSVELIKPHEGWITYGGSDGDTLRTVSRMASRPFTDDEPIAYTVRSGDHHHEDCTDCGKKHRSEFRIDVVKPPSADVERAVTKAVFIMEQSWKSKVPVIARVAFGDLGTSEVLANGGGTFFCRIRSMFDEILPIAAGEAILGRDLNKHKPDKGKYDVLITINKNADWYFGIDGRPPSHSYDLVTVLLHEFYHNLVFTGGIYVEVRKSGNKIVQKAHVHKDRVTRFDAFLANEKGCSVLTYLKDRKLKKSTGLSGVELLAAALTNDRLYFGTESSGKLVKLHAPPVFVAKSSIYHLSPEDAGKGSILTPKFVKGQAQHGISPLIIRMQHLYLDPDVKGASDDCSRPLSDPRGRPATSDDYDTRKKDNDNHPPFVVVNPKPFDVPYYGGFPVGWIIALSILGFILLLTLCALLFCILWKLKKKVKGSSVTSSISSSDLKYGRGSGGGGGHVPPGMPPHPGSGMYGGPPPPSRSRPSMGGGGGPEIVHSYKTPSCSKSSANGYPQPPPGTYPPRTPMYPSKSSGKRPSMPRPPSSSHKPHSELPTTKSSSHRQKPPSCKPKTSTKPSSSRKPPPSTRPPKSCSPKTEDYFDCS